jgi:hypothetical protein
MSPISTPQGVVRSGPSRRYLGIKTPPLILKESMQAGQEWGRKIGEKVMMRLKDERY